MPPSIRNLSRRRSEALATVDCSQSAHPDANDVRALRRHPLVEGHYSTALILFVLAGMSDGLDGLLARTLKQQTVLGQYLDPIADKLLLSTMFLVLSILHKIPWKFTVLVFSRDITILLVSALLYAIAGLRDFRPSIFGKANTFAQVAAVFFVLLMEINKSRWVAIARLTFLRATFAFTIISAMHYVLLVGQRLRAIHHVPAASIREQQDLTG